MAINSILVLLGMTKSFLVLAILLRVPLDTMDRSAILYTIIKTDTPISSGDAPLSHAPAEPIMIMANKTVLTMLLERSLLLARPAIPICSPGSLVITRHSVIKILFQSPITACLIRFRLDHVWFRRSRNRACPTRWFPEAANS